MNCNLFYCKADRTNNNNIVQEFFFFLIHCIYLRIIYLQISLDLSMEQEGKPTHRKTKTKTWNPQLVTQWIGDSQRKPGTSPPRYCLRLQRHLVAGSGTASLVRQQGPRNLLTYTVHTADLWHGKAGAFRNSSSWIPLGRNHCSLSQANLATSPQRFTGGAVEDGLSITLRACRHCAGNSCYTHRYGRHSVHLAQEFK